MSIVDCGFHHPPVLPIPATDTAIGNDAIVYNWDHKLRSASNGSDSIAVKYDPMGNRVYESSTVDGVTAGRKYIVDMSGQLPTILRVTDAGDGVFFDQFK